MNTDKHRFRKIRLRYDLMRNFLSLSVLISVNLWLIFLSSCATKPTDMRTLVPAETLVYLETNDLAAALQPIVDAKPFMDVAKSKPDFSALKGVQLAVAVTGFETSEEKLTDEHSVGRVQPRFVAVADTHAWNYQAVSFARNNLSEFFARIFNSEPAFESGDRNGGKYFTYFPMRDGDSRRGYAFVLDSLIYFGNDESAIDKCLAVKRGETDSILKTGKIPVSDPTTLAQGYVSTDGIAQIANLIGIKFASEAADESEVQSAIAGILPQLIRNSITEISWTSTKTEKGIEDKYAIGMPADVAAVFSETLVPPAEMEAGLFLQVSDKVPTVTLYNLKDPLVAWRSILLVANSKLDPVAGKILVEFSGMFFEPYGIINPELFFRSAGPGILTANYSTDGSEPVVIATVKNFEHVKKSIEAGLKPAHPPNDHGVVHWRNDEQEVQAVLTSDQIVIGSYPGVAGSFRNGGDPGIVLPDELISSIEKANAAITTVKYEDNAANLAEMLSEIRYAGAKSETYTISQTRFTKTGIDRRTTSDFGLIGSIIAQLGGDE